VCIQSLDTLRNPVFNEEKSLQTLSQERELMRCSQDTTFQKIFCDHHERLRTLMHELIQDRKAAQMRTASLFGVRVLSINHGEASFSTKLP